MVLAEKLRSEYDFAHALEAKHLPRGESSVTGPLVRLFKPFDELFVDFKVYFKPLSVCYSLFSYVSLLLNVSIFITLQDFNVEALEKFIESSSIPVVTVFNNDPSNHPYVIKFFNSPTEKASISLFKCNQYLSFSLSSSDYILFTR